MARRNSEFRYGTSQHSHSYFSACGFQKHWRDNAVALESEIDDAQAENVKIEDVMSVKITKIGLTNPVEDFIRMTSDKSQLPLGIMLCGLYLSSKAADCSRLQPPCRC